MSSNLTLYTILNETLLSKNILFQIQLYNESDSAMIDDFKSNFVTHTKLIFAFKKHVFSNPNSSIFAWQESMYLNPTLKLYYIDLCFQKTYFSKSNFIYLCPARINLLKSNFVIHIYNRSLL
ncbi:hypothetical protein [Mythimna sequax nucleopolyhedrovirus]|nr:hypothetical protein [Mythimna sequax nucleopolyhedrovirus]